jgi:hypothetical protein
MQANDRRSGHTWIELVVIIGALLFLAALLLPAMNRSHTVSPRSICNNNLRQLSFAMQNFVQSHRRLSGLSRGLAHRFGRRRYIQPGPTAARDMARAIVALH